MSKLTQSVAKPIRSFKPFTLKPIKLLHFRGEGAKYIGDTEITWYDNDNQSAWTTSEYETQLTNALNWYAQTQEDKQIVDLAMIALGVSEHFPELLVALKNSSIAFSVTAAKLIRMAHCGLELRFRSKRYIVRAIRESIANQKEIVEESETSSKPNIQDHINAKLRRVKGEIDQTFDHFLECDYTYGGVKSKDTLQKKPLSVVAEILNAPETTIPANRAKDLIEYCQKYLDEYRSALAEKMPWVEAYPIGKRKLKAAIEFWEQAIVDINVFGQKKQSMRKTRKRKAQSPNQIVGKLKFMKTFPELKLVSIDPTQVLKCNELWVFNTKLRKIGHYVALNDAAFEVKGTRLINLDPNKSVQKTLRKPAEQLKELNNYSKPGAIKWFNNIKAVATPLREAINADSILLKGVK